MKVKAKRVKSVAHKKTRWIPTEVEVLSALIHTINPDTRQSYTRSQIAQILNEKFHSRALQDGIKVRSDRSVRYKEGTINWNQREE